MEQERLKEIGPTTDLGAEELYREEPFSHDEYIKDDGELDVPAFIIRTTYEIWDMQMAGRINDYYHEDCVIHEGAGETIEGADAIIESTLATQSAFPDLEVKILDIIWQGNKDEGYKTSMPSYLTGTNTGHSEYGPPTGKELNRSNNMAIANCLIEKIDGRWQYTEEWTRHDTEGIKQVCTPDGEAE